MPGQNRVVLTEKLRQLFDEGWGSCRMLFFPAPCGAGKTAAARTLLSGKKVYAVSAAEPDALAAPVPEGFEAVLIDDFQCLRGEDRDIFLARLRENPKLRFVLLSRGALPGYLMSYRLTDLLTEIDLSSLLLDMDAAGKLLTAAGAALSDGELRALLRDTRGYALAVSVLADNLAAGAHYSQELISETEPELFRYFDEAIYRRFEPRQRKLLLLLSLSPFESFNAELARLVSGDNHAGELLSRLFNETSMFESVSADTYRFYPLFLRFLRWELEREYGAQERNEIYRRAGLYYELHDDYVQAMRCYQSCGEHRLVSELLIKNGRQPPGAAHYYEMEQYYYALPREEILRSPELMSAMSMLTALSLDVDASEEWYRELQTCFAGLKRTDANYKEAKSRLIFLDISLPQRGSGGLTELIGSLFRAMSDKNLTLPEFSVTSTMPSIMNGGKDFSSWSKKDDLLYASMKRPVGAVLGRDGVALADCAICESKLEKGDNVSYRLLTLMSRLSEIQNNGTPDIEFAAMGLMIRVLTLQGKANAVLAALENLRGSFSERGQTRFLPNMDAMRCRLWLRLGRTEEAERWLREQAPSPLPHYRVLYRYRYQTAALVELSRGRPEDALFFVVPFLPYCETCGRTMDALHVCLIIAICYYRMRKKEWREMFSAALDTAYEYLFVTPIAQLGAAVLPLLNNCAWKKSRDKKAAEWFDRVLSAARVQTVNYPDFLRPRTLLAEPLSPAERRVLKLLCYNRAACNLGHRHEKQLYEKGAEGDGKPVRDRGRPDEALRYAHQDDERGKGLCQA